MYYDFYSAHQLEKEGHSFKILIMTAILSADLTNMNILKTAYPAIHEEFATRMGSPDGFITDKERVVYGDPGEPE